MKRLIWLLLGAALLLSACNLAGDVTPPPGASVGPVSMPSQVATSEPISAEPPAGAPVVEHGEAIYLERCAPCHGEAGLGDGDQAADLPVAPTALGDPEIAREAVPADWYQVVTVGRMDRFMPPFSSLSDQQRWDVVGYALSLSFPQDDLDQGAELYQQYCAECHGVNGSGAAGGPPLNLPERYAQLSRSGIAAIIGGGQGSMPGFSDELSSGQIWSAAAYTQSLAFAGGDQTEAVITETEPVEAEAIIQGQAQNGTTGEPLGSGFEVTLHGFDGQQQVFEQTAETGVEGEYTFTELEKVPGRLFVISAEYQDVRYSSEVLALPEAEGEPLQLPITVYDTTSTADALRAGRVHLLIDQPSESGIRVVELWVVVNSGQQTVIPGPEGGVRILVPEQAVNLRFEDSLLAERYNPIEGGFQLAEPLRPGGQGAQIVFSYEVPFEGTVDITRPVTMPVNAVTVLVAEDGPRLEGEQLVDRGERQAGGEKFHQYDIPSLAAGQEISMTLRGPSFFTRLVPQSLDLSWVIGTLVFVAALAVIAWWYRPWIAQGDEAAASTPGDESLEERHDWLLAAIADLDEAYEDGKVEEAAYRRRRKELKNQLVEIIKRLDD